MTRTVSVIMPCYNDGAFIEESIASILNQTYPDIEIVIIDDGSDDPKTVDALGRLNHPQVRLLHSNRLRTAGARNLGIGAATGYYILPVDADDIILPTYIAKAVGIFDSRPEVGIVYCKAELFGAKSGAWRLPEYTLSRMMLSNIIFVTAMFRKHDWQTVGGFEEVLFADGLEDYDFWLSLLELGRGVHQIPEILFRYRIKANSRTSLLEQSYKVQRKLFDCVYARHWNLYQQHALDHMMQLRHALLRQTRMNNRLKSSHRIFNMAASLPIIRSVVERFRTR